MTVPAHAGTAHGASIAAQAILFSMVPSYPPSRYFAGGAQCRVGGIVAAIHEAWGTPASKGAGQPAPAAANGSLPRAGRGAPTGPATIEHGPRQDRLHLLGVRGNEQQVAGQMPALRGL